MSWSANANECASGGTPNRWTEESATDGVCPPMSETTTSSNKQGGEGIDSYHERNVYLSETNHDIAERRKAGRIIPFTNYVVEGKTYAAVPCQYTGNCYRSKFYASRKYRKTGTVTCVSSVDVPDPPDVAVPAWGPLLQGAWADAKSEGIDLLTELVESPKTVAMFRDFVTSFRRRRDHLLPLAEKHRRRGGKRNRRNFADALSDVWMESRYGWRPLVYLAHEISDQWEAWKSSERPFVTASRVDSNQASVPANGRVGFNTYGIRWNMIGTTYHRFQVTVRAKVILSITRGTVPATIYINPLATAWELVPYSFVADWFFNTSDLFKAHWPLGSHGEHSACYSIKTTDQVGFALMSDAFSNGDPEFTPQVDQGGTRFVGASQRYERHVIDGVPFSLKWDPRLSVAKIADLGVMMRNMISS